MPDKTIGISLLGHGIVGSGVAKILRDQRELLARRTGIDFEIRHVVVRDVQKSQRAAAGLPLTTDAACAIDDPKTQIVVEVMGGLDPASQYIQRALRVGK